MPPHVGEQLLRSRLQAPNSSSMREIAKARNIRSKSTVPSTTAKNICVMWPNRAAESSALSVLCQRLSSQRSSSLRSPDPWPAVPAIEKESDSGCW